MKRTDTIPAPPLPGPDLRATVRGPVAVLGLNRSGQATVRALARSGIEVRAWDDAPAARAGVDRQLLADLHGDGLTGVRRLILSPGIPHRHPAPHPVAARARAAGIPVLCDIALLLEACPEATAIGITGTNGKSTTTALTGHLLETAPSGRAVAVGGNIGVAALDLPALGQDGIYVLELSSYQLALLPDDTCFSVAVILNLGADHVERHGSLAGYHRAKKRILAGRPGPAWHDTAPPNPPTHPNPGLAVIGVDDAAGQALYEEWRAGGSPPPGPARTVIPVSGRQAVAGGVYGCAGWLVDDRHGTAARLCRLAGLPALPGAHNAQNLAAATAVALAMGVPAARIAAGAASFDGLAHRMETVARLDGVTFVNDSKATNLEAAGQALACYDKLVWIAGGRPKAGMDVRAIAARLPAVSHACLIGEAAPLLARQLAGLVPATDCGDLRTALPVAARLAKSLAAPVVLLSPGCASFDQFDDFEARGDVFRTLVGDLAAGREGRPC